MVSNDSGNNDDYTYVFFKDIWMIKEGYYIRVIHVREDIVYGVPLTKKFIAFHLGEHIIEGELYYASMCLETYNLENLMMRVSG